jgi:hypothetical protein
MHRQVYIMENWLGGYCVYFFPVLAFKKIILGEDKKEFVGSGLKLGSVG